MAYMYGDRDSQTMFPPSREDYVSKLDSVRVYDAFVDNLDFKSLGLEIEEDAVGAPAYDPLAMLKLLVFGYSYGFRSSRKLERACRHNIAFMWLMGGLTPGYKAISDFRKNNKSVLKKVMYQCARLCLKIGLIDGNVLFLDSSKIRTNASIDRSWSKAKCERVLEKVDVRIDELLQASEVIDNIEKDDKSLVEINNEEYRGKLNVKSGR